MPFYSANEQFEPDMVPAVHAMPAGLKKLSQFKEMSQ